MLKKFKLDSNRKDAKYAKFLKGKKLLLSLFTLSTSLVVSRISLYYSFRSNIVLLCALCASAVNLNCSQSEIRILQSEIRYPVSCILHKETRNKVRESPCSLHMSLFTKS